MGQSNGPHPAVMAPMCFGSEVSVGSFSEIRYIPTVDSDTGSLEQLHWDHLHIRYHGIIDLYVGRQIVFIF